MNLIIGMEKNQQFKCKAEAYDLTIDFKDNELVFEAVSDDAGKSFKGKLTSDTLPPHVKDIYGDCGTVFEFMEAAADTATLSDNG